MPPHDAHAIHTLAQSLSEGGAKALTHAVTEQLLRTLKTQGQQISTGHRMGLESLVRLMAQVASGDRVGRFVSDLPTGSGKTTAIICFAKQLAASASLGWSMAICAQRVEELEDIYRKLTQGETAVHASDIGFWHSLADAEIRATYAKGQEARYEDHRILLLTHARLQKGTNTSTRMAYRGEPRSLFVYDESLSAMGGAPYRYSTIIGQIHAVCATRDPEDKLVKTLHDIERVLKVDYWHQRQAAAPQRLTLPIEYQDDYDRMLEASEKEHGRLPKHHQQLTELLGRSTNPVRIFLHEPPNHDADLVQLVTKVPDDLDRLVVLDGSYSVRDLAYRPNLELDGYHKKYRLTLDRDQEHGHTFKRYDHLVVRFMRSARSGKGYADQDFHDEGGLEIAREVADVVSNVRAASSGVLIWVLKTKDPKKDYGAVIRQTLLEAGVDPDETILVEGTPRPKIAIETWGRETASNDWRHCDTTILCGCYENPKEQLVYDYIAETRSLTTPVSAALIADLNLGEICHRSLQAMSRTTMRSVTVDSNGDTQAKPATVYIFSRHQELKERLSDALPGATWEPWVPKFIGTSKEALKDKLAEELRQLLRSQAPSVSELTSRKLKQLLRERLKAISEAPKNTTYQKALEIALSGSGWTLVKHTLVRDTTVEQLSDASNP